ncbi:MAG: amidohydrolase family protein [Pirellulales bacterium]|nr:amidohydrolase family protein [Pirellulales bacterium]
MPMLLYGRRYDTAEPVVLETANGRISQTRQVSVAQQDLDRWPWIGPAMLDVQVNGYGGQEFSAQTLTVEEVQRIANAFAEFGVTRLCPTVTTQTSAVLTHALRTVAAACEASPALAARLPGIHLEGPFLTPQDGARGAHPLRCIRPPDWDTFQRFQEAAGGRIRILTLSPEYDGSAEFVRRVADTGVIVSIGHTSATPEQIRAAVDAGARMSTHLGNGSHPMLHRLRNYLWEQMAEDRLMAGIIVDGHHLPPAVVKCLVRAKTPERCILVSDISGQAGQPPGRYTSDFCDVEILPDGKLVIAGQREFLAGAALPTNVCVANVMEFAGVDLATAMRMVAHNPAGLLELEPGGLEPGDPADLVQFDLARSTGKLSFDVRATVFEGTLIYGELWAP